MRAGLWGGDDGGGSGVGRGRGEGRGREAYGGEFVSVAGEDDDADAEVGFRAVHGGEDEGALAQEAAPGVGCAEAPVLCKRHGAGDDFPVHGGWFGGGEVGEEGSELLGAEDGGVGVGFGVGAVGAGVEKEEGGGSAGEGEVGCVGACWGGGWSGRVDGDVVVEERVLCCRERSRGVASGPVVCDFMVVKSMEPGKVGEVGQGP